MKNIDSGSHVRGESLYVDDITLREGTLYAVVADSPVAHGKIKSIDFDSAKNTEGVIAIFSSKDIEGENQIGGIIPDEPLFAENEVHFQGQPIALIVAKSELIAREAREKIQYEIEELPVIVNPREAKEKGELIQPPRTFQLGNVNKAWEKAEYIFEGIAETGGQEQLYIETQGAYAFPKENGAIGIYSSTQGPTAVQRTAARVLGVPMHKIEVDVTRLGGGFGGKEDQATPYGVMAALAVKKLKRPVKLVLHRLDDMRMTGKRHPYTSDFKIGLDKNLKIIAYEADFYQNAGAAADLSTAVLERTLFHCTNSYYVPNVRVTAYSCRTNLPPNTAFRGFGGPQGMFVIEAAIHKAATALQIEASKIQKENLILTGNEFPYGQKARSEALHCWNEAEKRYKINDIRKEITEFNRKNKRCKKGVSFMPICFGISFTKTPMNQARALVHVYTDGSVGVSTGAVEMGQGVNTKMLQVAAKVFEISPEKVKLESTNTTRISNTSPSAASSTADLNGRALNMACSAVRTRLLEVAARELSLPGDELSLKNEWVYHHGKKTNLDWEKLVMTAHLTRVSLSEHSHYATPEIHFDKTKEKGHPFAYHVYGTAITVAKVDCLRGTYEIESVKVAHDYGNSMNIDVDLGQTEGGIVQGIGWMTMEELMYNQKGELMSNALSTYKIPDLYAVPGKIEVYFNPPSEDNLAIYNSKAVGEPPLMYGIGAYFAIRNAVNAFNSELKMPYIAPITPERTLLGLYENSPAKVEKAKEKMTS